MRTETANDTLTPAVQVLCAATPAGARADIRRRVRDELSVVPHGHRLAVAEALPRGEAGSAPLRLMTRLAHIAAPQPRGAADVALAQALWLQRTLGSPGRHLVDMLGVLVGRDAASAATAAMRLVSLVPCAGAIAPTGPAAVLATLLALPDRTLLAVFSHRDALMALVATHRLALGECLSDAGWLSAFTVQFDVSADTPPRPSAPATARPASAASPASAAPPPSQWPIRSAPAGGTAPSPERAQPATSDDDAHPVRVHRDGGRRLISRETAMDAQRVADLVAASVALGHIGQGHREPSGGEALDAVAAYLRSPAAAALAADGPAGDTSRDRALWVLSKLRARMAIAVTPPRVPTTVLLARVVAAIGRHGAALPADRAAHARGLLWYGLACQLAQCVEADGKLVCFVGQGQRIVSVLYGTGLELPGERDLLRPVPAELLCELAREFDRKLTSGGVTDPSPREVTSFCRRALARGAEVLRPGPSGVASLAALLRAYLAEQGWPVPRDFAAQAACAEARARQLAKSPSTAHGAVGPLPER